MPGTGDVYYASGGRVSGEEVTFEKRGQESFSGRTDCQSVQENADGLPIHPTAKSETGDCGR